MVANCTEDQFECSIGFCIPYTYSCDGVKECSDGSDEDLKYCGEFNFSLLPHVLGEFHFFFFNFLYVLPLRISINFVLYVEFDPMAALCASLIMMKIYGTT